MLNTFFSTHYILILLILLIIVSSYEENSRVFRPNSAFSVYVSSSPRSTIRAVLIEYPKNQKRSMDVQEQNDKEELIVRIRISPSSQVKSMEKYLIISDVYDPRRQSRGRTMVPYLFEVVRGEPIITYPLAFIKDAKYINNAPKYYRKVKDITKPLNSKRSSSIFEDANLEKSFKEVIKKLFRSPHQEVPIFPKHHVSIKQKDEIDNRKLKLRNANLVNGLSPRDTFEQSKNSPFSRSNDNQQGLKEIKNLQKSYKRTSDAMKKNRPYESLYENSLHEYQRRLNPLAEDHNLKDSKAVPNSKHNYENFEQNSNFVNVFEKMPTDVRNLLFAKSNLENILKENGFLQSAEMSDKLPSQTAHRRKVPARPQLYKRQFPVGNSKVGLETGTRNQARKRSMLRSNSDSSSPEDFEDYKNSADNSHKSKRKKRSSFYFDGLSCKRFENSQQSDIDVQSCDTCGGKGKKPNKPSKFDGPSACQENIFEILERQSKKDLLTELENRKRKNALNKHDVAENEICHCKSPNQQSKCICSRRSTRSQNEAWFSVFNISEPQPFLTTQIRIFRKREGSWWKISPSTKLSSLSEVFSDGNISISFSSAIDYLQLEKALRFEDHQLLIPKGNLIERSIKKLFRRQRNENIVPNMKMFNKNPHLIYTMSLHEGPPDNNIESMHAITDFGFFPSTVKVIDKCFSDDQRLCLNMLNDQAPGCTIKVKMPFKDNLLTHKDTIKVRISNILTDATTKDVLQVSVLVINQGIQSLTFSISISNYPTPNLEGAKTCDTRLLAPNIAETVTFLLPLIPDTNAKHKKFDCNVIVETNPSNRPTREETKKTVASRKLIVEPGKRCICVWYCSCHCIPKLETHIDYNICQKMSYMEKIEAGFISKDGVDIYGQNSNNGDKQSGRNGQSALVNLLLNTICLVPISICLGLLKAVLGTCNSGIDRLGYDYVYPQRKYDCASSARKFIGNMFLFTILPFRFLCACFTPSTEDLLVASSEWQCCKNPDSDSIGDESGSDSNEEVILSQEFDKRKSCSKIESKQKELSNRLSGISLSYYQEMSDKESCDEHERKSAKKIVQSLSDKRELRRKSRQQLSSCCSRSDGGKDSAAIKFIECLLDAKRVYRTFSEPIGNVCHIPCGFKYCIQGYFLPITGSMYEFVNFQPLVQYRGFSPDGELVKELHPPIFLCSGAFNRKYSNEADVLKSCDLFLEPPKCVPCINTRMAQYPADSECSSETSA